MKKKYISIFAGLMLGLTSCVNTFLDLDPLDQRTDAIYFKKAEDFKNYSASFYGQLLGWRTPYGSFSIYNFMDASTDLAANFMA